MRSPSSVREIIREAALHSVGVAAVSEVEYVPGPGLRSMRLNDATVRTYAHVVCLAERQESALARAFVRCAQQGRPERKRARAHRDGPQRQRAAAPPVVREADGLSGSANRGGPSRWCASR